MKVWSDMFSALVLNSLHLVGISPTRHNLDHCRTCSNWQHGPWQGRCHRGAAVHMLCAGSDGQATAA